TGPFTLEDAMRLDQLDELLVTEPWEQMAVHPDASLMDRDAVILGADEAASWRNGNAVAVPGMDGVARVYDVEGRWLGVGEAIGEESILRPVKVVLES